MPAKVKINLATLEKEWREGATVEELAQKYQCSVSHIYNIRREYELDIEMKNGSAEPPAPTPLDERVSQDSLMLSPWVRERIAQIRGIV